MNKYRKLTIYLIFLGMISILVGVSYSFFNYTRTGSTNNFSVGRISFRSKNEETINLTNLFPIDPLNATDMADPTKVGTYSIGIEGDTDYVDGIEYLVSVVDSNINLLPINIDISVSNGLGTNNDNYFTARESKNANIYKRLVGNEIVGDQVLLVGYIKPNSVLGTSEGVDGTITITAYLDKNKILVSDTYDGTESDNMGTTNAMAEGKTVLTTTEWNSLSANGVSFKVRIEANEGLWVTGTLEEIMSRTAVMDNINSTYVNNSTPGIDFGAVSSDTNGKGVYIRAGTENDEYPIMYYRGDIDDNNVLFGNYCWKEVRTTDTGGVKLLYNGEANSYLQYENNTVMSDTNINYTNDTTYPYTYDSNTKKWTSGNVGVDNSTSTFIFSVIENGYYSINYTVSTEPYDRLLIYKNGVIIRNSYGERTNTLNLGNLSTTDEIKVVLSKDNIEAIGTDNVSFEIVRNDGNSIAITNCNDKIYEVLYNYSKYTSSVNSSDYQSLAYIGYMYGEVYNTNYTDWTSNARFGSGFAWDGTNYTLVDDTVTTPDATHHYSCNVITENGTCNSIRYVVSKWNNKNWYITLSNGDGIEEAIDKMLVNETDSSVKINVDTWYENSMLNLTNRLEDTIWCNDRSILYYGGWSPTGDISSHFENFDMFFGPYERSDYASPHSNVKNQYSLECVNKKDSFTVNNDRGNKALTYPTALITSDEMVLAGGLTHTYSSTYIFEFEAYWSMSPAFFDLSQPFVFAYAYHDVYSIVTYSNNEYHGVRPMISIKPGQLISKGTGTEADPYVIE